ncbi:MAG: hypothetical protein IKQ46_13660 [Bacteroidales bacterium]|jgi:hypothetical protein|nr:hypothetical protein [Bacteroidales bacterium]
MKKFVTLLIALFGFFACQESDVVDSDNGDSYFQDEKDCNCDKRYVNNTPDTATVTFRVTINKQNPEVKVYIYEGSMTSGTLDTVFTMKKGRDELELTLGHNYTYVAKYQKDNDSIIVPVKARLYCEGKQCRGFYCYEIINNVIDLSLKF